MPVQSDFFIATIKGYDAMGENLWDRLYLLCFQMTWLRSIGSQRPLPHFEPVRSISLPWHHRPSPRPTGHDGELTCL
jgi:hypothetical protein